MARKAKDDNQVLKHAYLIIVHSNLEIINLLLKAIDDERNDIFVLVDKKSKIPLSSVYRTKKSIIKIIDNRIKIYWGDISLVEAMLILFREASRKEHIYYHFLSGGDYPIKSQNHIHKFCKENYGYEFIGFANVDKKKIKQKFNKFIFFLIILEIPT